MGLIRASYEVFKGEGELVLYCEHLQTVKYQQCGDFVGQDGEADNAGREPNCRLPVLSSST